MIVKKRRRNRAYLLALSGMGAGLGLLAKQADAAPERFDVNGTTGASGNHGQRRVHVGSGRLQFGRRRHRSGLVGRWQFPEARRRH